MFGVVVGCNVVVNAALSLPHHQSLQPRLNLQDIKYVLLIFVCLFVCLFAV